MQWNLTSHTNTVQKWSFGTIEEGMIGHRDKKKWYPNEAKKSDLPIVVTK